MGDPTVQQRARIVRNQATDAERYLWQRLRKRQMGGYRFRRQVPIAEYVADFACLEARLVIELDGGQHEERKAYDARRDARIAAHGLKVLRFWDDDVFRTLDAVLDEIWRALEMAAAPSLSLPRKAGEGREADALVRRAFE
ncbi:MAG: endonuclease domain-containing protein [Sulfurifustaceae bacterium]